MIGLSLERLNHSLAVARKMKAMAERDIHFPHSPEDMFYLGLLHDAAYEFVEAQEAHERKGGTVLRDNGYKYWREIYYHGEPDSEYSSQALDLLNYADMTTGSDGRDVSLEERLADIAMRYGEESIQHKKAQRLAEQISERLILY